MIDYKHKDLFWDSSITKQVTITCGNVSLTNDDLYNQEMTLEESLCSEQELRFGCCEASVLKFKVFDIFSPISGNWLDIKMVVNGNQNEPFSIGKYKVDSDKVTSDRRYREVTAYDAMYDIINASAINWYNTILPNKDSKVTMKQFRTSFAEYFGLQQQEITLANDDMVVEKTIQVEEDVNIDNGTEQVSILKDSSLSGLKVITSICEINGCFGHIGRDGKLHYIYLQPNIQGLYPANDLFPDHAPEYLPQAKTGHLYPQGPKSNRYEKDRYIKCDYEKDLITKTIDRLQIRQEENDIGAVWPDGEVNPEDNCYIIQDNFLVYGKSTEELKIIAKNIYEKINEVVYQPFSCDAVGNPCLEVGDSVRFQTKYDIVESYILKRTLKGIQALRDSLGADGVEKYEERVNGSQSSILQLKGKTNTLIRNVDETRSEIKDVEKGLSTRIEQTIKSISMSVSNDKTGKTAEVKLLITDEGGTQYEVKADKIDLTGLVSFTNLETGGQTIINGNNITTGTINCDLLNGGTILGQIIKGGEVTGATIKALEGLYLQYTNNDTRPPISGEYVFAETGYDSGGYGGISNGSFLNIKSPNGTVMIAGVMSLPEETNNSLDFVNAVNFPCPVIIDTAHIGHAYISSLQQTYKFSDEIGEIQNEGEGKPVQNCWININVRKSGAFTTVYGTYHVYNHGAGAFKEIIIGNFTELSDLFLPEYENVRTVGVLGRRTFIFVLTTDGRFTARNASDLPVSSDTEISSIKFRFDFFKWN